MILAEYRKEEIKKKLIAIFCIVIGTLIGIISLFLFYLFDISIFGFNIGLILCPVMAGYVETYLAERYYGKTTGAVSAFILFIVTVLYGFIFINTGLGFNIISIGSAAVILQAAFPTLVNYFIIVVILGIISYFLGIFIRLLNFIHILTRKAYFILIGKEYVKKKGKMDYKEEKRSVDINNLGILFLSTTSEPNREIKEFSGFYEGEILIQHSKKLIDSTQDHGNVSLLKSLQKAQEQAIINLSDSAKKDKCNAILDLSIEFNRLGGLKEDSIYVVARGTGVRLE
ncbi:hypothetical protein MBCUT_18180 [Methanobrevibacter cuticularis]|uniref:Heavy-metal-binding protein n=1 Tax=Methanobrevibacter cuticularis TaxID=47311 RepID=A0A166CZ14_9EURY|nr:heavy metal-binding domain-containing protein [Methanobrevibacter cuticularis]KZX15016.1 hypothetical protein MBCUT_18180 [Methanobrevibacter cuticularis]